MKKKVKMIFSGASTIVEVPRVIGGFYGVFLQIGSRIIFLFPWVPKLL